MWNVIECKGHPRDLGLEQGLALGSVIRQQAGQAGLSAQRSRWPSLSAFASGTVRGSGRSREMIRHFTHLSERADGLARGAGIPVDSLLRLQEDPGSEKGDALGLCAMDLEGAPGASLVWALAGSPWLVRRSRPEVGFSSLEVTQPWSVSALAGINETGLAVCIVPGRADSSPPVVESHSRSAGCASVGLLVQECLQRFEDIEAGMGWCLDRPVSGEGTILLADREGQRGAVHFGREACQGERALEGPLLAGGSESVRESMRAWSFSEPGSKREPLGRALGGQAGSTVVRLVCAERKFEVTEGEGQGPMLSLRAD